MAKRSLLGKMPGDAWQQFAKLRLLFTYQMTYPGKKLNFMGNEFAQGREWNSGRELNWDQLRTRTAQRRTDGIARPQPTVQHVARITSARFCATGFSWVDCHDADNSVISYLRYARNGSFVLVVLNFTPVPVRRYRIGVPEGGSYQEIFNSDSHHYGGSNLGNMGYRQCYRATHGRGEDSMVITLPPLAGIILSPLIRLTSC